MNLREVHRRTAAGAGLGFALLAPHGMAQAAQWSFQPGAQLRVLGETNPNLSPYSSGDAQALLAGADLALQRETETTALSFSASASQRRYEQATALDRLDLHSTLSFSQQRERLSWQARATATRDTTLTSELGLSGLSEIKRRHESAGASANLGWSASERLEFNAGASVQSDRYPGSETFLVDYRYRMANLGASHAVGPRSTLSLTAQRGQLDVSGSSYQSTDSAVMLQYQFRPSERLSLSLAAGPSWVNGLRSERGESFNASLDHRSERISISFAGGRRIAPTGRGYLTQRDEASLGLSLRLTEQLTGNLATVYTRSKDVLAGLGLSLSEVRYRRATAGLAWQLREGWSLGVNGGYADQFGLGWPRRADGLDLQVGISWNGASHVW